jgi:hypothetical protein
LGGVGRGRGRGRPILIIVLHIDFEPGRLFAWSEGEHLQIVAHAGRLPRGLHVGLWWYRLVGSCGVRVEVEVHVPKQW